MRFKEVREPVNARELASKLGEHPNTIYNKIKEGKIKATKNGKSYEVDDRDAYDLINKKFYKDNKIHGEKIINSQLKYLNDEKRGMFRLFITEMSNMCEAFDKAFNQLDELEWSNFDDNPIIIETVEKLMDEFEFSEAYDCLQEYYKLKQTIEVLNRQKESLKFHIANDKRWREVESINKKLGQERAKIKDLLEHLET